MVARLVLSVFPGIDILGRGFEAEGFTVLRGPDLLFGGDVRTWRAPRDVFEGVIGGPPCQDFSLMRRDRVPRRDRLGGRGRELMEWFGECVRDSAGEWFLCENV